MRKFHDIQQNTEEWFELRKGKITSSNFAKICANMGKAFGEPAHRYARKKALEIVTGELDDLGRYETKYFDRGHDLEPLAINEYELDRFYEVRNGGFTEMPFHGLHLGDSPDGLVGKKGCTEVKSVIPAVHWLRIEKGGYDTAYKWQIQGHLFVSDKEWCDFISYCPEFAKGKELYVFRVYRDEVMLEKMEDRLIQFVGLVNKKIEYLK